MNYLLSLDQHTQLYESAKPPKYQITIRAEQFHLIVQKTLDLIEQATGALDFEELKSYLEKDSRAPMSSDADESTRQYILSLVADSVAADDAEGIITLNTIAICIEHILKNPKLRTMGKSYSGGVIIEFIEH